MNSLDRTRRYEFRGMGEQYDRARPSYSPALFRMLAGHFGFRPGQTALEVGCGTGKATWHLAACGLSVTGIDIAPDLLAVASSKIRDAGVSFLQTSFEDYMAPAPFDYVISAQAFHWIDPAIAYPKSRALLSGDGGLILIWNIRRDADAQDRAALDALYEKHAPSLQNRHRQGNAPATGTSQGAYDEARAALGKQTHLFRDVTALTAPWQQTCTTAEYLALLDTYSDHKRLAPDERASLYSAIANLIDQKGGVITIRYDCVALTARPLKNGD